MSWKEIAKQKRDDRTRVEANRSEEREDRATLQEQLPGTFAEIVKRITAEVETFNAELPLRSDGIAATSTDKTARFEKTSSPAALLTMTLSEPSVIAGNYYAARLNCETTGRNAGGTQATEKGHFEISMGNLGLRFHQIGPHGAYSDLSGVADLVDQIIRPLVYFVT